MRNSSRPRPGISNNLIAGNKPRGAGRRHWVLPLLIGAAAALLYANTIGHQYALDDRVVTTENAHVQRGWGGLGAILTTGYAHGFNQRNEGYRPVALVTFAVETQFFGNNPRVHHAGNVLWFSVAVVLVFLLLRAHVADQFAVLATVLLFLAHPINTEVVANIKSRDAILCLVWMMATLLLLGRYARTRQARWLAGAAGTAFLAMLAKETGLTLVVLAPVVGYGLFRLPAGTSVRLAVPCLVAALVYGGARQAVLGGFGGSDDITIFNNALVAAPAHAQWYATATLILGKYLALLVWPARLSYDYSFNQIPIVTWGHPLVLLSLALYAAALVAGVIGLVRRQAVAVGIWLLLVPLSLTANLIVPVAATMAERFLFPSSLGFCLVVGVTWARCAAGPVARRVAAGALVVLVAAAAARTVIRNRDWHDNATLFAAAARVSPDSFRVHGALGFTYQTEAVREPDPARRAALFARAIASYRRSLAILDRHPELWLKLAYCQHMIGDHAAAAAAAARCLELDPGQGVALELLALLDIQRQEHARARPLLERALALQPRSASAHGLLGICLHAAGDYAGAIAHYQTALTLDPQIDPVYAKNLEDARRAIGRAAPAP